jgi:hypothetical protein
LRARRIRSRRHFRQVSEEDRDFETAAVNGGSEQLGAFGCVPPRIVAVIGGPLGVCDID